MQCPGPSSACVLPHRCVSTLLNVTSPVVGLLASLSDAQLSDVLTAAAAEMKSRALAGDTVSAVVERAFDKQASLRQCDPYIDSGLLVCPGVKTTASTSSHDCVFAAIGDTWVWDYPDMVYDERRNIVVGSTPLRMSVTLVTAIPGMVVDLVRSKARSSPKCHALTVTTFTVTPGRQLAKTATRRMTTTAGSALTHT